jgi:hypothetical protein
MLYEYQIILSAGLKPDITAANNLAQEGWELIQIGQSTSAEITDHWFYLLRKKMTPAPQSEQQPA